MGHHKQQATTQQTNFTKQSEDKEDDAEYESTHTTPAANASADSKEEMINITSCNLSEFSTYMVGQYGEQAFNEGFKIIKSN